MYELLLIRCIQEDEAHEPKPSPHSLSNHTLMRSLLPSRLSIYFRHVSLTIAVCLGLMGFGQCSAGAASIGPDDYGYGATDVPYAFENISGTGTAVLAGTDEGVISVPIGFNFAFYGASYANVSVTPDGLMSFGAANAEWGNFDLN